MKALDPIGSKILKLPSILLIRNFSIDIYILLYLKWRTYKDLYCIAQGTLLKVMCSLDGKGVWGRADTCVYMAESLHSSPEAITQSAILRYKVKSLKRKKKNPWGDPGGKIKK